MPIYKRHRLVHIHIPKTGGTAIERQFHRLEDLVWGHASWVGKHFDGSRWYEYQHLTAVELHELSGSEYESFESFAVVRSPYERLISDYLWRVEIGNNYPDAPIARFESFDYFIDAIPSDLGDNWSEHITGADERAANFLIHTRPQHHYVSRDGQLDPAIELLRFEKLQAHIERFFRKRNIENELVRSPRRRRVSDFYTAQTLEIVNRIYERDFELFSYEMIDPADPRFNPTGVGGTSTIIDGHTEQPDTKAPGETPGVTPARRTDGPRHRIAILVIAALNQPVYLHYIRSYWTELIRYTNEATPHIDVFLLLENGTAMNAFSHLADNVIEDPCSDLDRLCPPTFRSPGVPGILSKTIHALEHLQGEYDIFFRTNLSSIVKVSAFDDFAHSRERLCYSGGLVWRDSLRENLVHYKRVGPERSIASLDELDAFTSNTFVSGSGYVLNADEARSLVEQRDRLRYDLPDDVSVGLMLPQHEVLDRFTVVINPKMPLDEMVHRIRTSPACHVRLNHFPVETAEALWHELRHDPVWR